jgi:head-tail adaptor
LRTAELRNQVFYRRYSETRDSAGGLVPSFERIGPWYAKVAFKGTGSYEETEGKQTTNKTRVHFTIRRNPDYKISVTDEIEYQNEIYQIRSVAEVDPQRCYLLIETYQIGEYNTAA